MSKDNNNRQRPWGVIFKFALPCLLILAAIGFPFIKGVILEKAVRQSIEELNRDAVGSGQGARIEVLDWKKGWKRSTIQWRVQSAALSAFLGRDHLILVDLVDHGYSSTIVSTTDLTQNTWYKERIDRHLGGKNPLHIQTTYTLSGDTRTKVDIDAFSMVQGSDAVHVKSGSAAVEWHQDTKRLFTTVSWSGCEFENRFSMERVTFSSESKNAGHQIWEGEHTFSIDSAKITQADQSMSLEKLSAQYRIIYHEPNAILSFHTSANMGLLSIGPEDIRDVRGTLQLNHLDSRALEKLIRSSMAESGEFKDLLNGSQVNSKALNRAVVNRLTILRHALTDNWAQFLRKGCEVNISGFSAGLPEGEVTADVSLGLKRSMTPAGFITLLIRPSQITDMLSLSSRIKIPYQLVGYEPRLMEPLLDRMATGLFVGKGTDLIHEAQIRDGKLFLNGYEVELD